MWPGRDGILVSSILKIPSPSPSLAPVERLRPVRAPTSFSKPASHATRLSGEFRSTAAARSRSTPGCGNISISSSRFSIPRRPSTGRSASTTRRPDFLTGLNLQATYYIVKINGILRNFGNPGTGRFNDPSIGFAFVTPEDLSDPVTGAPLCAGMNATPWLCAPFQEVVAAVLAHPEIEVPSNLQTLVYWINDGGTMNVGWQRTKGIDWQASYDWEWGDLGAFNAGITGTYYLSQESQVPGGVIDDFYHTTFPALNGLEQVGVESRPRLKYRARLGWSDGTWSVTGFMDYEGHFFHTQAAPPNVNAACITPGGTVGGLPNYYKSLLGHGLRQHPAVLLHVRSVARLRHRRPAGERVFEERQRSARGPEHHGQERALRVPDRHRRRQSVRLRHHQEPVRPRGLVEIAEDVLAKRSAVALRATADKAAQIKRAAIHFGSQPFSRYCHPRSALPLLGDDERDGAALDDCQDIAGTRVAAAGADPVAVGRRAGP